MYITVQNACNRDIHTPEHSSQYPCEPYPKGSMGRLYIYLDERSIFYGELVGEYTSPMDPMGNTCLRVPPPMPPPPQEIRPKPNGL